MPSEQRTVPVIEPDRHNGLPTGAQTLRAMAVRHKLEMLWKFYQGYLADIKYIEHIFLTKSREMTDYCTNHLPMAQWQKCFDVIDFWQDTWTRLRDMVETVQGLLSAILSTDPRLWEILWRGHSLLYLDFWAEIKIDDIDMTRTRRLAETVHEAAAICRWLPRSGISPARDGGFIFVHGERQVYMYDKFKEELFGDMSEKMALFDKKAGQEQFLYRANYNRENVTGIGVPRFPYRALRYAKDSPEGSSERSLESLDDLQKRLEADDPGPKSQSRFLRFLLDSDARGRLTIPEEAGEFWGFKKK